MVAKCAWRSASTPIVSAMFANSSLYEGKPSGFISRRLHIWKHTDPDRCGILPFVFEAGFGYRALRRVGARRPDVLRRARRPLPARARPHLPPLPARRVRGRARDDRRLRPPPDDALPRGAPEADPRGARRRRRPARADLRPARALEGPPLRPRGAGRGLARSSPAGASEEREAAHGLGGATRARRPHRRAPGPASSRRELVDIASDGLRRHRDAQTRPARRAWLPRSGARPARARQEPGRDHARALGRRVEPHMWNA